jgi:hypothetical protein
VAWPQPSSHSTSNGNLCRAARAVGAFNNDEFAGHLPKINAGNTVSVKAPFGTPWDDDLVLERVFHSPGSSIFTERLGSWRGAPARGRPFGLAKFCKAHALADEVSHDQGLLLFHKLVGIDDEEVELGAHGQVLFEHTPLEDAEALVGIRRKAQVHACLEVLQLRAPIQDALERDFQDRL